MIGRRVAEPCPAVGVIRCRFSARPSSAFGIQRRDEDVRADLLGHEAGVLGQAMTRSLDPDNEGIVVWAFEQRGGHDRVAEHLAHSSKPQLGVRIIAPFSQRTFMSRKRGY